MNSEEIERSAKKMRVDRTAIDHARILTDAEAALEKSREKGLAEIQPPIWRRIMKSPITGLSSAAAVIIAVAVGIMHLGTSDGTSVVLAEVIQNVEQVNSAIMREKRIFTCDGKEVSFLNSDAVRYYSSEYGAREDMYNTEGLLLHQVYWLIQENVRIKVVPPMAQYERTELTEAERTVWGQPGFRAIVDLLKAEKPTPLGRKEINGREAEGFQIADSEMGAVIPIQVDSGVARLWIDVETSLPVRYEAEFVTSDKLVTSLTDGKPIQIEVAGHDLQWNKEIEPSIFEPNIGPDYTQMTYGQSIVQPLFEPNIPALYRDAVDRFIDERGHEIEGEQILVDMTYLRTQGEPEDWLRFLERQDIEFVAAPATDGVCYTILGPEKVKAIFELLESSGVLRLLGRPMVVGPSGYTASVAVGGFAINVKVEERSEKMDLNCSGSKGQAAFEIPAVRICPGEALLIEIVGTRTTTGQEDSSAEADTIKSTVLFLIKAERVKL